MLFGKRIVALRKERNLSQRELADKLGISRSALSLYEIEKREPDTDTLLKISNFFSVTTDYLLGTASSYNTSDYLNNYPRSHEDVGNSISYWSRKSEYGNDELAKMLGITQKSFDDICDGGNLPSLEILIKLSEILKVSTDCLLGLREKSRKPDNGEMPFRFDPEISRRLKEQAAAMDESNSFLADILGIEVDEVHNFFEYGFVPNIMVFVKIVEHFLVSSDYLLNRTGSTLTVQADEDDLLRSYRSLNAKSKTMALSRIYELEREESLVAAKNRYLDSEGKSSPSNGTGGGTMVG